MMNFNNLLSHRKLNQVLCALTVTVKISQNDIRCSADMQHSYYKKLKLSKSMKGE
jgi:hypothetical protein